MQRPDRVLYAALTAGSPTTVVEEITGDRIHPTQIPQGVTVPGIAYQRTSTAYERTIHSNVPIREISVFDVFCLGNSYEAAESLAEACDAVIHGNVDMQLIDRSSTKGDLDDDPFAVILTVEVDVTQ